MSSVTIETISIENGGKLPKSVTKKAQTLPDKFPMSCPPFIAGSDKSCVARSRRPV